MPVTATESVQELDLAQTCLPARRGMPSMGKRMNAVKALMSLPLQQCLELSQNLVHRFVREPAYSR